MSRACILARCARGAQGALAGRFAPVRASLFGNNPPRDTGRSPCLLSISPPLAFGLGGAQGP